jgi:hypothetical protein
MNPNFMALPTLTFADRWHRAEHIEIALSFPGRDVMNFPGMRHAPCYAFVYSDLGQLWILKSQGHAWTGEGLESACAMLTEKLEKLEWASLSNCLAGLDLPGPAEMLGPRLVAGLGSSLVDKPRLINALLSSHFARNGNLSADALKQVQRDISQYIDAQVDVLATGTAPPELNSIA